MSINKKYNHLNRGTSGGGPAANQIDYGEIAVNYTAGQEGLYIKNSNNTVVKVGTSSSGGEANVIETVKVNGTALTVTNKAVDVPVPTALSGLSADASHRLVTDTEKNTWNGKQAAIGDLTDIRNNASSGASAYNNMITGVTFNGNTATKTNKVVSITETDPVFIASPAHGITDSDITNWNTKTDNVGTVTGVKINGTTKNPTSGVVDLGTVLTAYTETDPTVPTWAKAASKPTYTASEVGALPTGTTLDNVADGTNRKLSNYATTGTVNTLNNTVTAHTGNTAIHVTTAQTASWNGKQDAISDLATIRSNASSGATAYTNVTAHTSNSDIHVTAAQKNTWNGKQDAINDLATIRNNASSGATAYTNVTAHTNNSNIHVTATQKTNWTNAYDNRITGVTFTSGNTNNATISGNKLNITGMTVPAYSASDSGKVLSINSSGQLVWITPVTIYTGTTAPSNAQGNEGDIYLQTS